MDTLQARLVTARYRPSGFDYMRLVLATGVIWLHSVEVTQGLSGAFAVWHGWARPFVGVVLPMFFALSGFLVAGSLERNKSLISFLGLRAIRLVPALAVEITLSALILGPIFTTFPLQKYFTHRYFFSYLTNIFGIIHYQLPGTFLTNPFPGIINSQLWTIPWEFKCYGLLSVIASVGLFGAKRTLVASMVLLQLVVGIFLIVHPLPAYPTMPGAPLIGAFLAGLTIYRCRENIPYSRSLAIGCAVISVVLMWLPPSGDYFLSFPVAYLTAYLGLQNPPRSKLLLSGDYSYGMYLYGYPIQQALTALGSWTYHWWLNMLISWPLALGFAAFSWWCIEKPALNMRKPLLNLEEAALKFMPFYRYSRRVFIVHRDAKPIQASPARS